MKGIIMAGGEGTRLRPLTCDCPKPMMRLMDKPLLQYAIELLKRHGIEDIAVTLGYQPDAITEYFDDGGTFGVRLRYYVEQTPLGTAGGVRQAGDMLDETFIVLSGDGVTDLDIERAADFHRDCGALATLVLKHADNPMAYGVVDLDPRGRVHSFHEKPDWSEVLSDTVNTGIYILEPEVLKHIPDGRPCDFGHELFPRLVREGLPVYGYVTEDYWCDVGDVGAYLGAHIDAMEGRIRLDGLQAASGKATVRPGAVVDRAAVLEGPCLIDAGARVRAGAYVGPYSVVGANCVVGEQASLKRSILWPGARLEARAQARGCVLATAARLGEGAQAYEESVLGANAQVEARGVLLPGVKLWPGKRVTEGERLDANRVWGGIQDTGFLSGALPTDVPAAATRAAQACAAALKPREMALGHASSPAAQALWHAAAAGCLAQGVRVLDAGPCTLPLLRHVQREQRADAALFVDDEAVIPLGALGGRLDNRDQRAVDRFNARQDYPRLQLDAIAPVLSVGAADAAYVADAAELFAADPHRAAPVVLYSANALAQALAERALLRAGVRVRTVARETDLMPAPGEFGLLISPSGEHCALSDEYGGLTDAQHQLIAAWVALESGDDGLILPDNATRGIEALLRRYRARAEYVAGERAAWQNALAERRPFQFDLHFDGTKLGIAALSLLTRLDMSLSDWRRQMPEVHRRSRTVAVSPRDRGRVLHAFAHAAPNARADGGVRFEREDGWAWVGADASRNRLRIVAEGASSETASELCDFCEAQLKRLSAL